MGILFGPVFSRRLGVSLGIDIVQDWHCSYDCIYCESGKTKVKTLDPAGKATPEDVIDVLNYYFSTHDKKSIDYLTFSGTGEPTLNPYIGEIITQIKKKFKIPLCLLTNSSLLWDHNLIKKIAKCDMVMASLDAISDEVFYKINRPLPGTYIEYVLIGLKKLVKISKGKIIIEIMLVKGVNDIPDELTKLSQAVKDINPHGVFLNTVDRPPAENVMGLTSEKLDEIHGKYFKGYDFKPEKKTDIKKLPVFHPNDIKFKKLVMIRGVSVKELSIMFKKNQKETLKIIDRLTSHDSRYYTTKYEGIVRLHYDPEIQTGNRNNAQEQ